MTHDHSQSHEHTHGNSHDRGFKAIFRYLRIAPWLWRSDVNDAVVALANPKRGERVVDIGAGMGPAAVKAAAAGATVVAVEPTPFMRNVLNARRLATKARSRLSVVDGAAEALPVGDGEADIVGSVNTMHHWTSESEGVAEIARVLAPGGRVVLVDENFGDPRHPDHERWTERHGSDAHDHGEQLQHDHDGHHDGDQDQHDDHHGHHDDDGHHGFSMVDAIKIGELITATGLTDVVAEQRDLGGVPVIAVTVGCT